MFNNKLKIYFLVILVFAIGLSGGLIISKYKPQFWFHQKQTQVNPYLVFLQEIRTTIQENYWDSLSEERLVILHIRAIEQLTAQPLGDRVKTYQELDDEIVLILERYSDETTREEFAVSLADLMLANLEPFGRSRLYSKQLEQELVEKVNNIDPETNHYQTLKVSPEASEDELQQAYQEQKSQLEQDDGKDAQQKLAQLETAHQTLFDSASRARYDEAGINPTMEWKLISPKIFYLKIKQFSPTTTQELLEVTQKVDNQDDQLATLILDLRGNFGGALDSLPYFLGPFIGNNQYAYQMLQQDKISDFKTRTGWLPTLARYKKVVVLIDEKVQSSAEVMADVLQRYNVGVLVGNITKGWGTVERVYPLKNQLSDKQEYSVFLVHHLTLRSDGLPIEGNGISPDIDIGQPDWQQELFRYYNDQELVEAIQDLVE